MPFQAIGGAFLLFVTVFVTVFQDSECYGMAKQEGQRTYVLPKLYNRKGDLSKRWYVQFQAMNVGTELMELKRIMCPEKFKSAKERNAWANDTIKQITKLLQSGFVFGVAKVIEAEKPVESKNIVSTLQNLLNLSIPNLAHKSVITYQSALNKFSEYYRDRPTPVQLSRPDVINFRDWLIIEKKNSARTANNNIASVGTIYARLMERTGIKENPFKVKALKIKESTKNVAFTDEDKDKVERYLLQHQPELYLFTRFIYFGFIRPGELQKIRFRDIAPDYSFITVSGLISKNGKTETAVIIPPLHDLIKKHLSGFPENFLLFGKGIQPSTGTCGKQVPFRRHEKILKHLGLHEKGYTLYSWKHTGAVNAYRAGVGIKELQNMLRHSSIQITDIYLKSLGLRTDPKVSKYNW